MKVASVVAVFGSCREELSARRTAACFRLAIIIGSWDICMFERPAMPIAWIIPGSSLLDDVKL